MTKCYEHEECEFNGQPECRLPDGMECPHGAKADKPVAESGTDIEQLIERLNMHLQSYASYSDSELAHTLEDAATALSTLQAENEKLRAELDAAIKQLHGNCTACKHLTPKHNEGPCRTCKHEYYHLLNNESMDNWEWRGPHKED